MKSWHLIMIALILYYIKQILIIHFQSFTMYVYEHPHVFVGCLRMATYACMLCKKKLGSQTHYISLA